MLELLDYTKEETLYEGPETCVRRARHRSTGETLVVKQPVSDSPSLRTVGRLMHEHQILGKLADVPAVVRCRGLTQQAGRTALWLEDPGLRSLDQLLAQRGRLGVASALRVALALCRGLTAIHAAGVVHKDINPQNLLVDEAMTRVVLIDFGIASELAQEATEASLPEARTFAYVSPEQTGRTGAGLDARTDLYSLGVTLFEMLSGRLPFLDKDALGLVHAHLAKAPPALSTLVAEVPIMVARIVARCLEKHPEQRYQTAKGLAVDLERCLSALAEPGDIEPFPIGQRDFSLKLQIPQTLVGREPESQAIRDAFQRAAGGAVEVLLLGGSSGVGKTALVRSVYREIAQTGRGLLLAGKHDQLGRSVPYAALAQAFSGLMSSLATSPKPLFDAWRERLEQALGPLSRVIADIVPGVEWLMRPLPEVPTIPTEMAYNRLKLSWIKFVQAVTAASPPLVLFLDDLQWVDPASLELLKTLLLDVGCRHLLVIAAYRDNETAAGHPLWRCIDELTARGVNTPRLPVGPLGELAVQSWLAAALSSTVERVQPLALTLCRKTQGNPFFLGQLLLELYRQRRVRRDMDDGVWHWDQDAVEHAAVTDNVVELMRSKVVELPLPTQQLLGQAACAGHSFSFAALTVLAGLSPSQVSQELWPALLAGLVVPSDGQYREAQALALNQQSHTLNAHYRFLHDRVQQAFYERIAPEHRAKVHLEIGRRLQNSFEQQGGAAQKLFELTRHLNLGSRMLVTQQDRTALARLNLQAAKLAKVNGSYQLQATLVEQAQALLGEPAEQVEPELWVDLRLERIETDFMLREFAAVHRRAQELLAVPALPALPRLVAQELRVRACVASGQYQEGERLGMTTLAEHGITYPDTNSECRDLALRLIQECDAWLDQHPDGFATMPADPSLAHLLLAALEASTMACSSYGSRSALMTAMIARNVKQATQRGSLTSITPFFIATFAHGRSAFNDEYRGAVRWAQAGEQAATRLSSPLFPECATFRAIYETHESPVEQSRERYQAVLRTALTLGSYQGISWGTGCPLYYVDLWGGRPLRRVAECEQAQREMMQRAGDTIGQQMLALIASFTAFLLDPLAARPPAGQEWLAEGSRFLLAGGAPFIAEFARIQESFLFLAFGETARALERADETERFRADIYGLTITTDIPLWRGLAAAKSWSPNLPETERDMLYAKVAHSLDRFRYFAAGCAENFLHKLRLLEAEDARIRGQTSVAMAKYDEAISLARKERFVHIEALASQLCAEFYLAEGRERIAALYLHEACDAYTRWDALALVAYLEGRYPELLKMPLAFAAASAQRTATESTTTAASTTVMLDVNTAVRAARTLASELDPSRVVGRLMELLLENAGAQRGVLVLGEGDALAVTARLSVSDSRIETGFAEPIAQSVDLPITVVRYVARTGEALVVGDARSDVRLASDVYLKAQVVRSILALPLTHRAHLVGVLYLEHRDVLSAFPTERVALLSVIASQAAIAVENATLYRNVQAQVRELQTRNQEIQQLNGELRRQIEQRSQRLMDLLLTQEVPSATNAVLQIGSLLGDSYRVVRAIGEGGMGAVYEVERTTDQQRLAAKVLHSSPDRQGLGRFVREAQILARLNHANLISIFDVDVTSESRLYIVMELVTGGSLWQQRARFGDVPWGLGILRQVAEALAALHAQAVVHRDLKPENILLASSASHALPIVKLADFGISVILDEARRHLTPPPKLRSADSAEEKISWGHPGTPRRALNEMAATVDPSQSHSLGTTPTDSQRAIEVPHAVGMPAAAGSQEKSESRRGQLMTQTGVIIGTPLYMAPELLYGSKNAQPSSDVFSLGVIAFELLTGSMPFAQPAILRGSPADRLALAPSLRQCPGLKLPLAEVFERCLAVDPGQRPSAQQLATLLAAMGLVESP